MSTMRTQHYHEFPACEILHVQSIVSRVNAVVVAVVGLRLLMRHFPCEVGMTVAVAVAEDGSAVVDAEDDIPASASSAAAVGVAAGEDDDAEHVPSSAHAPSAHQSTFVNFDEPKRMTWQDWQLWQHVLHRRMVDCYCYCCCGCCWLGRCEYCCCY